MAGLIILMHVYIVNPMNSAVKSLANNEEIRVSSNKEFNYLTAVYNRIHKDNEDVKESLKYEAEHDTLTGESYYWENTNPLINPFSEYYYPYATGLKTGFTDEAGSCLVASAERDGVKLVAVALGGISIYERNQNLIDLFEAAWQEVL